MKSTLKELRQHLGMNQEEFGAKIGLSRNVVTNIELGRTQLSDMAIVTICNLFNVNEHWLKTGEGDMFGEPDKVEEIANITSVLFNEDDDSFRYRLIKLLAQMDERDMEKLKSICEKLVE